MGNSAKASTEAAETPPERATEPQGKRKAREPSKHHVGKADRPTKPRKQLPAKVAAKLPDFIQRYLQGEPIPAMAAEVGEDRRRIYEWMLADMGGDKYGAVVTQMLVRRIAIADQKLENATDQVDIARAREMARYARMDFERRRPHLYAAKPLQVTVNNVNVDAGLVGSISELITRKDEAEDAEIVDEQRSNSPDPSSDL